MARPTTLTGAWKELAEAFGTVKALAAACGVSYQTIERWARGDFAPHVTVQKHVNSLAKRRGIKPPFTVVSDG